MYIKSLLVDPWFLSNVVAHDGFSMVHGMVGNQTILVCRKKGKCAQYFPQVEGKCNVIYCRFLVCHFLIHII